MGIYIKGMEMPKSCCNCPLAKLSPTGQTLICNYTLSTVPWDDKPFDCPLVPVPPHGDLIERDALMKGEGRYILSFGKEGIDVAEISRAPIIIPAEEGE